jgi:DNA-binding FadR family transcriptional regulator
MHAPAHRDHATQARPSAKRGEQLAFEIEREIIRLSWPVNHVLGLQTELMQRYRVGRTVLREAIRLLEQRGVARMRSGPSGGLTVAAPAESAVVDLIATHLELAGVSTEEVLEMRRLVEQLAVEQAALRIDGATLTRMRHLLALFRQTDERDDSLRLLVELQHLVGQASRNPALELLIDVLTRVNRDYLLHDTASIARFRRIRRRVWELQMQLVEALATGDADRACDLVRRYIDESRSVKALPPAESVSPGTLQRSMRRVRQAVQQEASNGRSGLKLAQITAGALQQEIRRLGLPLGLRLGSEAEMARRVEVSGAVFREAVCILQQHSLIRVVKGRGGGLVVSAPDSANICRSAVLYLKFMRFDQQAYLPLRRALDLEAVRLAARRHGEDDRRRLRALMEQPPAVDVPTAWAAIDEYQMLFAQCCRNHVLELVLRIMSGLTVAPRRREQIDAVQAASLRINGDGFASWLHASYRRIVAAILERDEASAERALLQHFDTMVLLLKEVKP